MIRGFVRAEEAKQMPPPTNQQIRKLEKQIERDGGKSYRKQKATVEKIDVKSAVEVLNTESEDRTFAETYKLLEKGYKLKGHSKKPLFQVQNVQYQGYLKLLTITVNFFCKYTAPSQNSGEAAGHATQLKNFSFGRRLFMNIEWKKHISTCVFTFKDCDPALLGSPENKCVCSLRLGQVQRVDLEMLSASAKEDHNLFVTAFRKMMAEQRAKEGFPLQKPLPNQNAATLHHPVQVDDPAVFPNQLATEKRFCQLCEVLLPLTVQYVFNCGDTLCRRCERDYKALQDPIQLSDTCLKCSGSFDVRDDGPISQHNANVTAHWQNFWAGLVFSPAGAAREFGADANLS